MAPAPLRPATISLQAGWWTADLQWLWRTGPSATYVAFSVPWTFPFHGGVEWYVPFGARFGYQYFLTNNLGIRLSGHLAAAYVDVGCCDGNDGGIYTMGLVELGFRYQHPGGVVLGIDVPLVATYKNRPLLPPRTAGFTQAYLGWSWRL